MQQALIKAGFKIDIIETPTRCRYCAGKVVYVDNKEIYGRSYGSWPYAYSCTSCDAYVGVHPGTTVPLGTLADKETRQARKDVKPAFNRLWQEGDMTRSQAYKRLAGKMDIPTNHCHISWFDSDQCYKALAIIQAEAQG